MASRTGGMFHSLRERNGLLGFFRPDFITKDFNFQCSKSNHFNFFVTGKSLCRCTQLVTRRWRSQPQRWWVLHLILFEVDTLVINSSKFQAMFYEVRLILIRFAVTPPRYRWLYPWSSRGEYRARRKKNAYSSQPRWARFSNGRHLMIGTYMKK